MANKARWCSQDSDKYNLLGDSYGQSHCDKLSAQESWKVDDGECIENEYENLVRSECWLSNGTIIREHGEKTRSLQHQAGWSPHGPVIPVCALLSQDFLYSRGRGKRTIAFLRTDEKDDNCNWFTLKIINVLRCHLLQKHIFQKSFCAFVLWKDLQGILRSCSYQNTWFQKKIQYFRNNSDCGSIISVKDMDVKSETVGNQGQKSDS